jgi:hypothetical protein
LDPVERLDLWRRETRPLTPARRDVIVDHVEELVHVLADADAANTRVTFAERLQRLHGAIPQPLVHQALAGALPMVDGPNVSGRLDVNTPAIARP